MRFRGPAFITATLLTAQVASAQPSTVTVDDDEIVVRGCIADAGQSATPGQKTLVWSRSDIMLAAAELPASATAGVFYWLDDEEDLKKHVGQRVEIKGELEDFEKGEIEVKKDGDFTTIELKLDGDKEEVRVPTAWLGTGAPSRDREFDIMARRIDIENVRVLGPCTGR